MPIPPSLDRVTDKIVWAKEHFQTVARTFEGYFNSNPAKIVSEPETAADNVVVTVRAKKPPPDAISYAAGDCIQNVRSAMDYLVRELVLAAHNEPTDREVFPICERSKGFESACKRGHLDRIPIEALALIEWMQPYNRGKGFTDSALWILDELANINKHRRLLLTDLRAARVNMTVTPDEAGGGLIATNVRMPTFQRNAKFEPFPEPSGVRPLSKKCRWTTKLLFA